jgi:uncharacterized protein (DUF608 family)
MTEEEKQAQLLKEVFKTFIKFIENKEVKTEADLRWLTNYNQMKRLAAFKSAEELKQKEVKKEETLKKLGIFVDNNRVEKITAIMNYLSELIEQDLEKE